MGGVVTGRGPHETAGPGRPVVVRRPVPTPRRISSHIDGFPAERVQLTPWTEALAAARCSRRTRPGIGVSRLPHCLALKVAEPDPRRCEHLERQPRSDPAVSSADANSDVQPSRKPNPDPNTLPARMSRKNTVSMPLSRRQRAKSGVDRGPSTPAPRAPWCPCRRRRAGSAPVAPAPAESP